MFIDKLATLGTAMVEMGEKAKIPLEFVCVKTSYIKNKGSMKIICFECPSRDKVGYMYTRHALISKAHFNRVMDMCPGYFHVTTRTQKYSNCGDCCQLDLEQNTEIRARIMNGECMQVVSQYADDRRLIQFKKFPSTSEWLDDLFYTKPQIKQPKSPPIQKSFTIKPIRKRVTPKKKMPT